MAMKLKPESSSTPSGITSAIPVQMCTIQSIEESNKLASAVNEAAFHGSTYLVRHPHASKFNPGKQRVKQKPTAKAKPTKAKHTQKRASRPVMQTSVPVVDDSEIYALWWCLHTDLSHFVVPYPIQPKDRAEGIRKMEHAKASRQSLKILEAVGVTPEAKSRRADLSGGVPHPATPEFAGVIARNSKYNKGIIARCVTQFEIAAAIPGIRQHGYVPVTSETIDNSDAIAKLEALIATPVTPVLESAGRHNREQRAEDRYWKDKLDELGLGIPAVITPKAAINDSQFDTIVSHDTSERQIERDQWMTPEERLVELKHEPWTGNEEVEYLLTLQKMHREPPSLPVGVIDYTDTAIDFVAEGTEYAYWLRDHDSSCHRRAVEEARATVDPSYEMDLGMQVHLLSQVNAVSYDNMVVNLNYRRVGWINFGTLNTRAFSQSSKKWDILYKDVKPQSIPVIDAEVEEFLTMQREEEALAEKILSRKLCQMPFQLWAREVESQHLIVPVLTDVIDTTDDEVSPTPQTDTIFNKWEEERKGAEVVYLSDRKEKNKVGVQKLTASLSLTRFISSLSDEQKEWLRNAIG